MRQSLPFAASFPPPAKYARAWGATPSPARMATTITCILIARMLILSFPSWHRLEVDHGATEDVGTRDRFRHPIFVADLVGGRIASNFEGTMEVRLADERTRRTIEGDLGEGSLRPGLEGREVDAQRVIHLVAVRIGVLGNEGRIAHGRYVDHALPHARGGAAAGNT